LLLKLASSVYKCNISKNNLFKLAYTFIYIYIYFCKLGVITDKTHFLVYPEFLAYKNYFIKLKLNQQPAEEILIAKHLLILKKLKFKIKICSLI